MVPGAVSFGGRGEGAPVIATDRAAPMRPYRLMQGALPDDGGLVLGSTLAARIGARLGDRVRFSLLLTSGVPAHFDFVVRGIAGGAFGGHDAIFVDRAFLNRQTSSPHAASILFVHSDDHHPDAGRSLAALIGRLHPEVQARGWADDSAYLSSAVGSLRAVSAISHSMVVAAVAIPVLALLYIATLQRRREVGVLAAIGFSRREVFWIFLFKALLVALAGGLLGALVGVGLVRWFQLHPIFEYQGFIIRPRMSLDCFLKPMSVVLSATVLAGVYPAWRASRVEPAPVLKGME
jgi:ABC-type lipoprotein release transport system permease subunit